MPQIGAVVPQGRFVSGFNQALQVANQLFLICRQIPPDLDQVGCAVCHESGGDGQVLNEGFQLCQLFQLPFLPPVPRWIS